MVMLSINNWRQVNSKWTVTERFRPTDVFLFFFTFFFMKFFNDRTLNTKYTTTLFTSLARTWINSLYVPRTRCDLFDRRHNMNPHKEKIIINRNISEIPLQCLFIFFFSSLVFIFHIYLLLLLDLCTHCIIV